MEVDEKTKKRLTEFLEKSKKESLEAQKRLEEMKATYLEKTKCPKCGKELFKWDKMCKYCGSDIPKNILNTNLYLLKRYDFNLPEVKLIERYWNDKCTALAKKMLGLYGINGINENRMGKTIFERCLIKEEIDKFIKEHMEIISPYKCTNWKNAVNYYAQALLFKMGYVKIYQKHKRCLYCGKEFIPLVINARIIEGYLPKKSFKELEYCEQCLKKAFWGISKVEKTEEELVNDLKDFVNVLGFIPPKKYFMNKKFRSSFKENFHKVIPVLIKIAPVEIYERKFGSWLKALISAGILEGEVRETPRGIMCVAKDGHDCLSLSERRIDDWLFINNIKHMREPKYPRDKDLNPNRYMRADWKVKNIFIEFFGLKGNMDYDTKTETKIRLCEKHNISLIEIYSKDLDILGNKLSILKNIE
jgi:uncharacterized protein with PIN domain